MAALQAYMSRLTKEQSTWLSSLDDQQKQAVVDALALAMYIDHEVVEEEIAMFDAVIAEVPAFGEMSDGDRRAMLDHALEVLEGLDDLDDALERTREMAEQLPAKGVRELVFAMAVAITLADGVVVDLETSALGKYVEAFGLDFLSALEIINNTRDVIQTND